MLVFCLAVSKIEVFTRFRHCRVSFVYGRVVVGASSGVRYLRVNGSRVSTLSILVVGVQYVLRL